MATTAFLPSVPVPAATTGRANGVRSTRGRALSSVRPAAVAALRRTPLRRRSPVAPATMATPTPGSGGDGGAGDDDGLDAAERTRRALSAEPPAVVFRNKYDPSGGRGGTDGGEGEGFGYEAGSTGVDVWLIAGICTFRRQRRALFVSEVGGGRAGMWARGGRYLAWCGV